jgi:hypothetical protein
MTPCCEHALFLHECLFNFVFCFTRDGWQIKQCVCIKFGMKLGKSFTKTLEMLPKAFGEHLCLKAGRVSFDDDKHSGRPSTSKMTENVEKIQELIHDHH